MKRKVIQLNFACGDTFLDNPSSPRLEEAYHIKPIQTKTPKSIIKDFKNFGKIKAKTITMTRTITHAISFRPPLPV